MKELLVFLSGISVFVFLIISLILICILTLVFFGSRFPRFGIKLKFLDDKNTAIIITFVATIFFTLSIRRVFVNSLRQEIKQEVSSENAKNENRELKHKNTTLEDENRTLQNEIDNLKHSALAVQKYSEICEMNFAQLDLKTQAFHQISAGGSTDWLKNEIGKEIWIVNNIEWKGVKYGVDLKNVRVQENENGDLKIYGIKGKYNGTEKITDSTPLKEIVRYKIKNTSDSHNKTVKTDKTISTDKTDLALLEKKAEELLKDDRERVSNTTGEYDWILKMVENNAENFILAVLSSSNLNQKIEFIKEEDSPENAESLEDYLQRRIKQLENNLYPNLNH